MELCRKVPCRVELGRSNVCMGVERSWPKRIFQKDTFAELRPKEKRSIYRLMEKKAVFLDNKYVDKERLKERVRRRTTNALAYYWEERYLKHRYLRLKALGETQAQAEKHIESVIDVDDDNEGVNGDLTDDDSDNDNLVIDEAYEPIHDSSQTSIVTVINTQSNASKSGNTKEPSQTASDNNNNGNDDVEYPANDENVSNNSMANGRRSKQNVKSLPKRLDLDERPPLKDKHTSVRVSSAIQEVVSITLDSEQDDGDEDGEHDRDSLSSEQSESELQQFNDIMTESYTRSQHSDDRPTSVNSILSSVHDDGFRDPTSMLATPRIIDRLQKIIFPMLNEDDEGLDISGNLEADSLDFLTQNMMEAKTSTQK